MTGFSHFCATLSDVTDCCPLLQLNYSPFCFLQFFQFGHEKLKKILWFVGERLPETGEETVMIP